MNNLVATLRSFGPGRLILMGVIAAGLLGFFAYLVDRLTTPPMTLLYGELAPNDSSQIVAKLEALNVEYKLAGDGSQILVPEDGALRLRMTMAADGLPSGGSVGYELFDRTDALGTTSFVQNVNSMRALEGELARTISTIELVEAARVHLVLPKRELFAREKREPSASIVLKLRRGSMDRSQVAAIQNLVAAAVPDLQTQRVSIVDDNGNLLSRTRGRDESGGPADMVDLRIGYEERLKQAVESMVEQSVGIGNVRAEVSVQMKFDRITENAEVYNPDGQVVRSTQTIEDNATSTETTPDSVSVGNNLPDAQAQVGGGAGGSNSNTARTEETVNYEISKTVRTEVKQMGTVERLSVAVLVDGNYARGENGETTYSPREQAELDQIASLVRSAIGFDEARGDTIEVVNMRFMRFEDQVVPEVDLPFLNLTKGDYFRLAEIATLLVLGVLVVLLVVRPMLRRLFAPAAPAAQGGSMVMIGNPDTPQLSAPAGAIILDERKLRGNPEILQAIETGEIKPEEAQKLLDAIEAPEEEQSLEEIESRVKASSVRNLVELVEKHPEDAIAIMRNWMYQDA
ncbi:MAG: flagellar basal-body MS-ring/collar protein FliF [Alphaproteobacteria bacterium]